VLQFSQPRERGLVVCLGHPHRHAVVLGDERPEGAESFGNLVEDHPIAGARDVLFEAGDPQSRRPPCRAGVRKRFARDHLQQARLACAVAADERDPLAGFDAQIGVLEERKMAVRERHRIKGQ
jgi:hypothetical protein